MLSSINNVSLVSLAKYSGINRTSTAVAVNTYANNKNNTQAPISVQHIDDDADIGTYSAFSARKIDWSGESLGQHSVVEGASSVSKLSTAGHASHQPNIKPWQDLYALTTYILGMTDDEDFDAAFRTVSYIAVGWSFTLEEMQGVAGLTDALRDEFAAELERYAPLSEEGKIDSMIEYAVIRMIEIARLSAPEEAKEFAPLPADYDEHLSLGVIIETFTKAFDESLAAGDFFKQADTHLWKALDVLVTPSEESLLDERFYQYLKDNAQQIFEEIKASSTPDPDQHFNLFGGLKDIIDTARQQYVALPPVMSKVFSEKGLFEN